MGKITWNSSVRFSFFFQPKGDKTFLDYHYVKQLIFLIPVVILLVNGATTRGIEKIDNVLVSRKVLNAQTNAIRVLLAVTNLCHLATCHPCNMSQRRGQGNFP